MKYFILFLLACAFSFNASSQVVTGVYRGKMEVDSPKYTVDFELTLKEKDGQLYGYCHRLFIVEDVLYYNLVKVTARIKDSVLIVEDEKSVSNNFKEKTSGVKTVMFFTIQKNNDTVSVMPGEWSTSRTKRFLPITGKISVRRESDYLTTQLYKRLEEKKLDQEMAFETKPAPVVQPVTKPVVVTVAKPVIQVPVDTMQTIAGKIGNEVKPQNNQPAITNNQPKQQLPTAPVVKPVVVPKDTVQAVVVNQPKPQPINKPTVVNPPVQPQPKPQPVVVAPSKPVVQPTTKPTIQQPVNKPVPEPVAVIQEKPQVEINKVGQPTVAVAVDKPVVNKVPPVINNPTIIKRETEIIQAVEITEDSVVLALYDNGEIDGDTVSVFVNNELVVSKVGLSAKAYKKTIFFKPGETVQLTFFAENLGAIPPNTGLLVITTNTERYQVFFSSNFNKSSSILLRRKE